MTTEALLSRLEALLGSGNLWTDTTNTAAHTIGALRPEVVVQPETAEEVAEVLTLAHRERLGVVPWGCGMQMHHGHPPRRYDIALSLASMRRVVDYDDANFILIAEAGMAVREAYRLTIPRRQFLPLGFPGTRASLGGLLATNTSGYKRLRYGSVRDLLLGVQAVLADGTLVRFGGRVVKNVAGYDMSKLFIGSFGAFGIVVETTYRLVALPAEDRGLAVVFPTRKQALTALAALRQAAILPSSLTLLHAQVGRTWLPALPLPEYGGAVVLVVNYDGTAEAVQRQSHDSRHVCTAHGGTTFVDLDQEALLAFWELQERWRTTPRTHETAMLQVRLGVPPSRLGEAIQLIDTPLEWGLQGLQWIADAGNGQLWLRIPLPPLLPEVSGTSIPAWLHELRMQLHAWHGYGVVEWAPQELHAQLDVWGETSGVLLLQRYKKCFDPEAILNPGRYVAHL